VGTRIGAALGRGSADMAAGTPADCAEAIARNVQDQVDTVDGSWDGQAGAAAFN